MFRFDNKKRGIREWLALTRNEIANKNQIGSGRVSSIVNECRRQGDILVQLNHNLFQVFKEGTNCSYFPEVKSVTNVWIQSFSHSTCGMLACIYYEHSIERFKQHWHKVHKVNRLYLIHIQLFILNV
jgi:hypothetical protein